MKTLQKNTFIGKCYHKYQFKNFKYIYSELTPAKKRDNTSLSSVVYFSNGRLVKHLNIIVIHHTNRQKKKKKLHRALLLDEEKVFDKNKHLLVIKIVNNLEI